LQTTHDRQATRHDSGDREGLYDRQRAAYCLCRGDKMLVPVASQAPLAPGPVRTVRRLLMVGQAVAVNRLFWLVVLCCIAAAGPACGSAGQRRAKLKALLQRHEWFRLRDIVNQDSPYLYQAAVAFAFHDFPAAEQLAHKALKTQLASVDVMEAHKVLYRTYDLESRYSDALCEFQAARKSGYNQDESTGFFLAAASRFPRQSVVQRRYSKVAWRPENNGLLSIPLSVNGKGARYVVDTGASHCDLSEAEAKRLGLTVLEAPGLRVRESSGKGAAARVAVADKLAVGDFRLANVVFLVIGQDPHRTGKPVDQQGLLGLSVLSAFETVRWSRDGTFEIGFPAEALSIHDANLSFDWGGPLMARAEFQNTGMNVLLDSGSGDTDFLIPFAKDFPAVAKTSIGGATVHITGAGGSTDVEAKILPQVEFDIGGVTVTQKNATLLGREEGGPWHHARLGLDVLNNVSEVTLDFRAMKLKLKLK